MMKVRKNLCVLFGAVCGIFLSSSPAQAGMVCGGGGYVKSVAQNMPWFHDNGVIGISVLHDDGVVRYYYTYQNQDVANNPETRTLLQLATAAYLSQAHVWVSVSEECSYTYKESDGHTWVTRWDGLLIQNF